MEGEGIDSKKLERINGFRDCHNKKFCFSTAKDRLGWEWPSGSLVSLIVPIQAEGG